MKKPARGGREYSYKVPIFAHTVIGDGCGFSCGGGIRKPADRIAGGFMDKTMGLVSD